VIKALNETGVPAVREGRNDILVDDRKISGFAQYTSGDHVCTHGSILYDTDMELLTGVLIAKEEKLHPKGIVSVRSRVTNVKQYITSGSSVADFILALKNSLTSGKEFTFHKLKNDELKIIDRISKDKYSNDEWNLRM